MGEHCAHVASPSRTHYPRPVQDYAGAWTKDRGRCHGFVCTEDDGGPTTCREPPVRSAWRRAGQGAGTPRKHAPATPGSWSTVLDGGGGPAYQ